MAKHMDPKVPVKANIDPKIAKEMAGVQAGRSDVQDISKKKPKKK